MRFDAVGRCVQLRAEVDLPRWAFRWFPSCRGAKAEAPARKVGRGAGDVGGAVELAPDEAPISGRNCSLLPKVGRFVPSLRVCLAHEAGIVVDVFERFARALGHAEEGIFCHVEGDVDFVR